MIYVTVNVRRRRRLLNTAEAVQRVLAAWADADHWMVGRYVVMPDHIHLFCSPVSPGTSLKKWVEYWRAAVSRSWPRREDQPIWQKDFFDRQLRSGESYREKWLYVWQNPEVASYCQRPEDWPWQGELHVLPWHDTT